MKKLDVNSLKEILKRHHLLSRYGIEKMSLYGSFARGGKFNDIDILIEDARNYDALIEFKQELEALTRQKVDIMIKKFANPIVLYRAQKDLIHVSAT